MTTTAGAPRFNKAAIIAAAVAALFIGAAIFLVSCRIHVPTNKVLIKTKLTGAALPQGDFVAVKPGSQGVQLTPFNEGYHWINPYTTRTKVVDATIVSSGEVGVLVRLFGQDLPGDQILATPGYGGESEGEVYKGIIAQPLQPGKYNINTSAYRVEKFQAMQVPPGTVGVSINLSDPAAADVDAVNQYVMESQFKGVTREGLKPGTYYRNPYCESIVLYDIRTQRLDFMKTKDEDGSIDFQSSDAFTLNMEGTIEWSVDPVRAPELLCRVNEFSRFYWTFDQSRPKNRRARPRKPSKDRRPPATAPDDVQMVGGLHMADLRDVEDKIIVPYTRSFIRLLGAKYKAEEYISGQRRQEIQTEFQERLKAKCDQFGIRVNKVAIRKIWPPDKIKEIVNERSMQEEQRNRIRQNIETVKSVAVLSKEKEGVRKSQLEVQARTAAQKKEIQAEQNRQTALLQAESELAVAQVNEEKAQTERDVLVIRGKARIDADFRVEKAKIDALRLKVYATGGGRNYIKSIFVGKFGGGLEGVLTSDDSFFMKIFEDVLKLKADNDEMGPPPPPFEDPDKRNEKKSEGGGR